MIVHNIHHDKDRNGDMNKNWLGIPTGGACLTNNATGFMGPPYFSGARFVVKANVARTINMFDCGSIPKMMSPPLSNSFNEWCIVLGWAWFRI